MQKIALVLVSLIFVSSFPFAFANQSHLQALKSRYPYGLIGDDFGILNEEDLATNTCEALPTPFSGEKTMTYPYWQCFPIKDTRFECAALDPDPLVKDELAYMQIEAKGFDSVQSYLARDAMEAKACREYLAAWRKKTQGERHVCLSGPYAGFTGVRDGRKETDWVFEKFKTHKGCESNRSDCHLGKKPEKSCILPKGFSST